MLALVAGAAQPSVGPLIRARWSAQLHGTSLLRTAFAWESLVDEAVFILGPPLATIVALQVAPSAALVLATTMLIDRHDPVADPAVHRAQALRPAEMRPRAGPPSCCPASAGSPRSSCCSAGSSARSR